MSREALDVLGAWRPLLGELGELGRALCTAIQADDLVGAMAAMHQLRRVRSAIARVEAPIQLRGEPAELEAMAAVSALTVDARAAEGAMARWLAREVPGDARLLASPLGVAVLADIILPPVWDFESDLVVLVGAALAPVAEILAAVGQRRIVILGAQSGDAIRVESADEACVAVRTMVPGPPAHLVVHGAAGTDPGQLDELVAALRTTLSDLRIHRNTVRAFSRTWVEQGLANLPAIGQWPSVATVGESFAGKPMVIVAPGPSLAKNVDQLRALRGKAIITAFSHSLKPVLAAGVVPDLVVTVDPQDVRYHFAGCDLSTLCMVNAATVHPTLFELPARRFLTLSANCAIDDWIFGGLGEDASVPGGGSVATTAFSLALRWGCSPIVFVGLDLSFPGGAYYVSTSSDGRARAEVTDGVMRVEGWSPAFHAMKAAGGPSAASERAVELPAWSGTGTVPSSFMFSLFHRWFVERMHGVPATTTVYNCTEGGARIAGMQHRPLAEVVPELAGSSVDVAATLDALATTGTPPRAAALTAHLTGFSAGLRRTRRLALAATSAIARGDTDKRLTKLERSLAAALRPLGFISLLAQHDVERAHDTARRPAAASDYLAASSALFATLLAVTDHLEPALVDALARITARRTHGRAA